MEHPPVDSQITFLYTADLDGTAKFYEDVLGLALTLDQGTCRIYKVSSDGYVGICRREEVPVDLNNVIITIVSPDVDEWYEYLCERGVLFDKTPEVNTTYKIYHCFLRDPNGYMIEIQEFIDPRWP
jgi:catechol 2,3-dioxygenase-like lactoylglutathione lyase family enzyme